LHLPLPRSRKPEYEQEDIVAAWASRHSLDVVVWTDLPSNFEAECGKPFSVENAILYLKTLSPEAKAKATEYVWRAPEFVRTPLRRALQQEPWFSVKTAG
jgi:hypothetical protein